MPLQAEKPMARELSFFMLLSKDIIYIRVVTILMTVMHGTDENYYEMS